jgi:hypothetical protein
MKFLHAMKGQITKSRNWARFTGICSRGQNENIKQNREEHLERMTSDHPLKQVVADKE